MPEQQPIGILLISTRKYKQFVQPLVKQIEEYFLPDHRKIIFVFTDEYQSLSVSDKNQVFQLLIPDYKYPYATLYRYRIFQQHKGILIHCSHLFYLDVDMAIVGEVSNVFLVSEGLVAVRHPGFYVNDGWGDSNNPKESESYLPVEKRKHYYCGGCQGGEARAYLKASATMAEGIWLDDQREIKAEWNDETFWNWYLHTFPVFVTEFPPSYCMVEQEELRKAWGIDSLPVKIIALAKNHEEIRN